MHFEAKDDKMMKYLERIKHECSQLKNVKIEQVSCNNNSYANDLETVVLVHNIKY